MSWYLISLNYYKPRLSPTSPYFFPSAKFPWELCTKWMRCRNRATRQESKPEGAFSAHLRAFKTASLSFDVATLKKSNKRGLPQRLNTFFFKPRLTNQRSIEKATSGKEAVALVTYLHNIYVFCFLWLFLSHLI